MVKKGIFGTIEPVIGGNQVDEVLKPKHIVTIDFVHVTMLNTLPGISSKSAKTALKKYNIQILLNF